MMDIVDTVNIEGTRWFGGEILGNSGNTKLTRISRHDRRLGLTKQLGLLMRGLVCRRR